MAPFVLDLARFGLTADLALLMGLPLFWWSMGLAGRGFLLAALALGGIALSALWLLASTAIMTGTPLLPPAWASMQILLTMTPIGTVLAVRVAALVIVLALLLLPGSHRVALIPAAIAAATLAWTGHAGASEAMAGTIHRAADVVHIWAAAGWVGALGALLHAVMARRPDVPQIRRMLDRFATFGTIFVATLIVSGLVNGAMIVGLANIPALTGSLYGWLLAAKLALFVAMLGLAAVNRWRLTPALERATVDTRAAIAHLRLSLAMETAAALAILGLVSVIGTLDPLA